MAVKLLVFNNAILELAILFIEVNWSRILSPAPSLLYTLDYTDALSLSYRTIVTLSHI